MTNWRRRRQGKYWRASTAREKGVAAQPVVVAPPAAAPIIFCLRSMARDRGEKALEALVKLMDGAASEHVRVAAANAILDRGFGKPLTGAQAAEEGADEDDDGGIEVRWLGGE